MIKNYLKIFLRNLWRQIGYSSINILGLSVGMACSLIIVLWAWDEISYDNFHLNRNQLYLVVQRQDFKTETIIVETTPSAIAYHLKKDYPEIIDSTRIFFNSCVLNYEDKHFFETINFVDPSFLEMFTFPLVKGDPGTVFSEPSSMVITEKMAKKYFGSSDPLGKIIIVDDRYDFKVTGVLKDIPRNSSIKPDFLVPLENIEKWAIDLNDWGLSRFYTFVQLQKNISYKNFSIKIYNFFRKYFPEKKIRSIFLHPFSQYHLYSIDGNGGRIILVGFFSVIALFILLIACINFINLSTGRAIRRSREIGIRKVVGAARITLVKQFFMESGLMVVVALILALLWIKLALPAFNQIAMKQLTLDIFSPGMLLALIGTAIFTCLLAGSYPALFLSSFQPANILKEIGESSGRKGRLRKLLVFVQFSISVFLIIGATVIYKQLYYIKSRDLGIDKENIIHIPIKVNIGNKYKTMKDEWLKNPNILNVTISSHLPTNITNQTGGWDWEGENSTPTLLMAFALFGYDYTDTFKIPMVQGRFYSKDFSDDESIVINEKAAEAIGLRSPLGKRLSHLGLGKKFNIIGVVKDFNFMSLHHKVQPLVLMLKSEMANGLIFHRHIFIRTSPGNIEDTIKYIKDIYKKISHDSAFDYNFLEDEYDKLYQGEQRIGKLIGAGAFLAIFISCLGVVGLASFMVEQRTNEIAVRKVFGASIPAIIKLLLKEFIRLILAANALAWVLAYFAMDKFLQFYASRTSLSWWIFVVTAAFSLGIALLMISFQTLKVALKNPVESLKYE
jgi:putative ABC transport system permease protein